MVDRGRHSPSSQRGKWSALFHPTSQYCHEMAVHRHGNRPLSLIMYTNILECERGCALACVAYVMRLVGPCPGHRPHIDSTE
jgi:hypothetical protein